MQNVVTSKLAEYHINLGHHDKHNSETISVTVCIAFRVLPYLNNIYLNNIVCNVQSFMVRKKNSFPDIFPK